MCVCFSGIYELEGKCWGTTQHRSQGPTWADFHRSGFRFRDVNAPYPCTLTMTHSDAVCSHWPRAWPWLRSSVPPTKQTREPGNSQSLWGPGPGSAPRSAPGSSWHLPRPGHPSAPSRPPPCLAALLPRCPAALGLTCVSAPSLQLPTGLPGTEFPGWARAQSPTSGPVPAPPERWWEVAGPRSRSC